MEAEKMSVTQAEIDRMIADRDAEGQYVEFKRGAALTRSDNHKTQLVKDCTGFANAAGGTIFYGIAEAEVDGVMVATGLDPVTDKTASRDWITEVLRSNTMPPLHGYEINDLPQAGGGRIVVITIQASSTAHQNLRDRLYYQRAASVTSPMVDYQIRDVMARRSKPDAAVRLEFQRHEQQNKFHRYKMDVEIRNTGPITLEKWWLDVDIPRAAFRDSRSSQTNVSALNPNYHKLIRGMRTESGQDIIRVSYGDPWLEGERSLIHPSQTLALDRGHKHYADMMLEVDDSIYAQVTGVPIAWTLYFNNSPPKAGLVDFTEWCVY